MLENQLLLVISLKNHGVFVKPFDLSDQFHSADKKNSDSHILAADCVEINRRKSERRRFVLHVRNPLKRYKLFNKLMDQFLNILAVSRSIEPFDAGLSSKPGQLTFRISPGITLDYTYGFVATVTRIE